ncbi:5368_t:CDS:2, partial [Scutellospora calospora]
SKLNVLEAIKFIGDAWNAITQQTIHNCWKKTGILPDSNSSTIETATEEQQNLENNNLEDLRQILESETANSIKFEDSLSDEELDLISHKEGLNALTTFIDYFKQQTDADFKIEDLNIFKKYNNIVRKKYLANMKQKTLENFL